MHSLYYRGPAILLLSTSLVFAADFTTLTFEWSPGFYETLPNRPGLTDFNSVKSINDNGVIAFGNAFQPILWNGTDFQQLPFPSGYGAGAIFVNNAGTVAGALADITGKTSAAIWDAAGNLSLIPVPVGSRSSFPTGLNSAGTVVGYDLDQLSFPHPFLFANGTRVDLASGSFQNVVPAGINSAGVVIGNANATAPSRSIAVYWAPGSETPTALPCNTGASHAIGINSSGQIAGYCITNGFFDTVVWDLNGNMIDIGHGSPHAINDLGQVIGDTFGGVSPTTTPVSPYIWSESTGLELLDNIGPAGASIWVEAINNRGVVVGIEVMTPEPESLVLSFAGLLLLIGSRYIGCIADVVENNGA